MGTKLFGSGRRGLWLLTGAGIVAVLVGGAAYASIPDSNGVIHACYQKDAGTLRVINAPDQSCKPSEEPIQWNVQGPTGGTGSAGPAGPGVTVTSLPAGNSNCPAGGTQFTDADNDVSYACSAPTQTLDIQKVENAVTFGSGGGLQEVDVSCPTGFTVLGGGYASSTEDLNVIDNSPNAANTGWQVVAYLQPESMTVYARVECAQLTST